MILLIMSKSLSFDVAITLQNRTKNGANGNSSIVLERVISSSLCKVLKDGFEVVISYQVRKCGYESMEL